tara:strand:+ start:132 stop:395 length:264 start_codon:yes stop_codon:yes gene_type:complete
MSSKNILGWGVGTTSLALLINAYAQQKEEAKKEFDPVETTLDGLEKYILDPIGNLSPGQAAAIAGVGLGGVGAYKGYQAFKDKERPS